MAHFETYILNYNGIGFLPRCLAALARLELGPHSLGVNVIDNASTDSSQELIEADFPGVNYIALDKNYGFSVGNNLGIQVRRKELKAQKRHVDFQVLLNNDTEVDSCWLLGAYDVFAKNSKAGIVGSKAIFDDHFIPISISCENSYSPTDYGIADERMFGPVLQHGYTGVNICTAPGRIKFKNAYVGSAASCPLAPDAQLFIPVENPMKDAWMVLYFENHHPDKIPLCLSIKVGENAESKQIELPPGVVTPVYLSAEQSCFREYIQNAGSFITSDWHAGDRGFLTLNDENFNAVEEVAAVCGVSMFVRDELWQKLNGFDETFFAYYEDTDLSIRAQQLGWQCIYTPHSRLRHVHCGSGVEFSEYFLKNVTWSHLLFASKTMKRSQWQKKLRASKLSARSEFQQFESDHILDSKSNLQAYFKYLRHYPTFVLNRIRTQRFPVEKTLAGLLKEVSGDPLVKSS